MLLKTNRLEQIPPDVFFLDDKLIYKSEERILKYSYEFSRDNYFFDVKEPFAFENINRGVICIRTKENIKIISQTGVILKDLIVKNYYVFQVTEVFNKFLVCRIRIEDIIHVGVLSFGGEWISILQISEPIKCNYKNNVLVVLKNKLFVGFDDELYGEKWQLDIRNLLESETTQLFGDLIEYEGKLYFFLSDQKDKYGIYCIDIATGKVLNHTNQIAGFMKLSGGLLYMNKAYTLTTLHPDTFEIREIDLRSVLEPQGLSLGDMMQINLMVGQLYYFVCQNGRRESATVGIINLEDNTLVWTTEIPIESGSYWVKEIQVHGNRLFVLTQGGTLHIFEREENV